MTDPRSMALWLILIIIVLVALVVAPLGAIWALNTIFGLAVPYTLKTWTAAFILVALIAARSR